MYNAVADEGGVNNQDQLPELPTESSACTSSAGKVEEEYHGDDCLCGKALMIFSAPLIRELNDEQRLPTTYAGVRRVRPSSKKVHQAWVEANNSYGNIKFSAADGTTSASSSLSEPIVYKVVDPDTGQERRMTAKEKKKAKEERHKAFLERKAAAKKAAIEAKEAALTEKHACGVGEVKAESTETSNKNTNYIHNDDQEAFEICNEEGTSNGGDKFVQLKINKSALEEELADLQGERGGVPPVLLSSSQARTARLLGLRVSGIGGASHQPASTSSVIFDEEVSQQWAVVLKHSMKPPEETRVKENMRAMAYDIRPQAWSRMKPANFDSPSDLSKLSTDYDETTTILPFVMRHRCEMDNHMDAIVQLLNRGSGIFLSCGAKFGCDLLLYDGPRSDRHAFAGLRVVHQVAAGSKETGAGVSLFPLPRAYDLAGYVRCLNTAGKLALLATVVGQENGITRVAIIDLALEKIREDKKRKKPTKTLEQRMQNLSKK